MWAPSANNASLVFSFVFLICSKMSLCLELRLFSDEVRFSGFFTKFIFGWYHEHKPLNRQECWRTWTFFFPFCRQRSQYVILQCYTGLHLNARDTIQSLIIGHLRALFLISPMEGQKVCCWTSVFHFVHTFFFPSFWLHAANWGECDLILF